MTSSDSDWTKPDPLAVELCAWYVLHGGWQRVIMPFGDASPVQAVYARQSYPLRLVRDPLRLNFAAAAELLFAPSSCSAVILDLRGAPRTVARSVRASWRKRMGTETRAWMSEERTPAEYCLVAGIEKLRPGGRLAAIVDATLLHQTQAGSLWKWMCQTAFPEWLARTDSQTAVLLVRKSKCGLVLKLAEGAEPDRLRRWAETGFERSSALGDVKEVPFETVGLSVLTLGDLAIVRCGVAIPDRSGLLLTRTQLKDWEIPEAWTVRCLWRASDWSRPVVTAADLDAADDAGVATYLLRVPAVAWEKVPAPIATYLSQRTMRAMAKTKARRKRLWYRLPEHRPAWFVMPRFSSRQERIVENQARAWVSDEFLALYPRPTVNLERLRDAVRELNAACNWSSYGTVRNGVVRLDPIQCRSLPL